MTRKTLATYDVPDSLLRADLDDIATDLDAMAHHLRELESMPAEHAQILAVRYARDIEGIARSARRSAASPRTYRN